MDEPVSAWTRVVNLILAGDPAGQESLYEAFGRGVRFYLAHELRPQDIEDKMHDTFLKVVAAVGEGQLRDPAGLPAFVHTIARRLVARHVAEEVRLRADAVELSPDLPVQETRPDPERAAMDQQRIEIAERVLAGLGKVDREIVVRFYFEGQEPEQICRELGLTDTQFRLRKSRAKQRFAMLAGKMLKREKLFSEFGLRKKAAAGH